LTLVIANNNNTSPASANAGTSNAQRNTANNAAGLAANAPLNVHLTPELGLPGYASLAAEGENGANKKRDTGYGFGFF
jgi:hypothetical protein